MAHMSLTKMPQVQHAAFDIATESGLRTASPQTLNPDKTFVCLKRHPGSINLPNAFGIRPSLTFADQVLHFTHTEQSAFKLRSVQYSPLDLAV